MLTEDQHLEISMTLLEQGYDLGPEDLYVVVDGDHIGNSAATPLLHNNVAKAVEVSKLIHRGQNFISWWAEHHGGQVLIDGGDNSVLILPKSVNLEDLRTGYHDLTGFTLSAGTGVTTENADKALVVAKWRGRDQVAAYDDQCEQDFMRASAEANDAVKLKAEIGESSYKPCPKCQASNMWPGPKDGYAEGQRYRGSVECWTCGHTMSGIHHHLDEDINDNAADDYTEGTAEGLEISGHDWNLMVALSRGQAVDPQDPGVRWLSDCKLVSGENGALALTATGKAYVG